MTFRILSDIHLEFAPFAPLAIDADAILLAGNIGERLSGLDWATHRFPNNQSLYGASHHEFYGARLPYALSDLATRAESLWHPVSRESFDCDWWRARSGATLRADYANLRAHAEEAGRAMFVVRRGMNDDRHVRFESKRKRGRDRIVLGQRVTCRARTAADRSVDARIHALLL